MKSLVLLCAILAASYFGWRHFNQPKEVVPREKVEAVLSQAVIPSKELADICSQHPEICEEFLENRKITISGEVQKVLVKGVSSQDLSIELEGSDSRRVSLSSDVNRAARMNRSAPEGRFKFEKHGRQIIVYGQSTRRESDSMPGDENKSRKETPTAKVFIRELDTVTFDAVFKHLDKNAVVLEWKQPGHL